MPEAPPLAHPEIQARLIAEAVASADVGLVVWDDSRAFLAANQAACELLGTSLDRLLGERVAAHVVGGDEQLEHALRSGFATGRARVDRFDGSGPVDLLYVTFATRVAGLPYLATLIAPAPAE